jgi:hypothetical protein
VVNKKQKPFRLVNENGVWIHHVANVGANRRSAFIFDERDTRMVNRIFARRRAAPSGSSAVNFVLNRFCLQRRVSEVGGVS